MRDADEVCMNVLKRVANSRIERASFARRSSERSPAPDKPDREHFRRAWVGKVASRAYPSASMRLV